MKIRCGHGYFSFEETTRGQVSDYMTYTGFKLIPQGAEYTFLQLDKAPDFSIKGMPYLGFTATKTYEGSPADIFEANEMVFNLATGLLVPISSITRSVIIDAAGNRFISSGLIQPGSKDQNGETVKSYSAWFSRATLRYYYTEVTYV